MDTDRDNYFSERTMTAGVTPAVRVLLVVNVGVFVVHSILRLAFQWHSLHDPVFLTLGFVPARAVFQGWIWQFLTYAFLHGDILHIIFNMLFLYWFGREVEMRLGLWRFAWFYAGAAVAGAATFCAFFGSSTWPMIGASAAVMGIMVVYAVFWPYRTILFFMLFPMKVRTFVLLAVGIDLYSAVFQPRPYGGVAALAHLGGAAYGYVYLKSYPWWVRLKGRLGRRMARAERERERRDDERLDHILDKVHQRGMQTLTWAEKRFLRRMGDRKAR